MISEGKLVIDNGMAMSTVIKNRRILLDFQGSQIFWESFQGAPTFFEDCRKL